jgi:hypothetical protein
VAYRLEHPFSGAVYAGLPDGRVEVIKDGHTGIFDMFGTWLSGELRTADPELIRWVGSNGYTPASRHLVGFTKDEP